MRCILSITSKHANWDDDGELSGPGFLASFSFNGHVVVFCCLGFRKEEKKTPKDVENGRSAPTLL
jgi:hypothetical protein